MKEWGPHLDENDRELIDRIVKTGCAVPIAVMEQVCRCLAELPDNAGPQEKMSISAAVTPAGTRQIITKMLQDWIEKRPDLSPAHLSWALLAAGASDEAFRGRESVEIVWTGPASRSTAFRRTDQALLELIESAMESLIIVTFAAYKIARIADAIVEAGQRNLDIALVVESKETSSGHYVHKELATTSSRLLSVAKVYTWPLDKRPTDSLGNHGSLHAKCAVADNRMAFISSANLTEYALNINMEMGVLIKGGGLPGQMRTHFRGLIRDGVIEEIRF